MKQISPTQKYLLKAAASRPNGAIYPLPENLIGKAAKKVMTGLQNRELITDVTGNNDWQISEQGYLAIGLAPKDHEAPTLEAKADGLAEDVTEQNQGVESTKTDSKSPAEDKPIHVVETDPAKTENPPTNEGDAIPKQVTIPTATKAADQTESLSINTHPITDVYTVSDQSNDLGQKKPKARAKSKQARVIEMLHRPEGATLKQIVGVTGWHFHTVRGFLSGTIKKKLGLPLTTERTRVVGPNQVGSPGSFTVYRIQQG